MDLDCVDVGGCLTQLYKKFARDDLPLLSAWLEDLESLGRRPPSIPRQRTFAYLTQGGQLTPRAVPRIRGGAAWREEADFDTFYMAFSKPSGDLYFPNSTFQQGRNALLRLALSRERVPGYKYFIFTDEDVTLKVDNNPRVLWSKNVPSNPWRRFEEFLLHFKPRVSFCRYPSHGVDTSSPYSITTSHDLCLAAYSRMALQPGGLPLMESNLDWLSSWNYDYIYVWFMKLLFSTSSYQCNSVRAIPGGTKYHNKKTEKGSYEYKQGVNRVEVRDLLEKQINWEKANNPLVPVFHRYEKLLAQWREGGPCGDQSGVR